MTTGGTPTIVEESPSAASSAASSPSRSGGSPARKTFNATPPRAGSGSSGGTTSGPTTPTGGGGGGGGADPGATSRGLRTPDQSPTKVSPPMHTPTAATPTARQASMSEPRPRRQSLPGGGGTAAGEEGGGNNGGGRNGNGRRSASEGRTLDFNEAAGGGGGGGASAQYNAGMGIRRRPVGQLLSRQRSPSTVSMSTAALAMPPGLDLAMQGSTQGTARDMPLKSAPDNMPVDTSPSKTTSKHTSRWGLVGDMQKLASVRENGHLDTEVASDPDGRTSPFTVRAGPLIEEQLWSRVAVPPALLTLNPTERTVLLIVGACSEGIRG